MQNQQWWNWLTRFQDEIMAKATKIVMTGQKEKRKRGRDQKKTEQEWLLNSFVKAT